MTEQLTLRDVSAPVAALTLLMAGHPDLPAPDIQVSPVYPDRLRLAFHGERFDAWLSALRVDLATVTAHTQGDGLTKVRKVTTAYGGAQIKLVEFIENTEAGESR
jgi:hypothetical protein